MKTDTEKWYHWNWDYSCARCADVTYQKISRWRRGWVTIYEFVTEFEIKYRVYFPGNFSVGF